MPRPGKNKAGVSAQRKKRRFAARVRLHLPAGRTRRWAEAVVSAVGPVLAAPEETEPPADGPAAAVVHWGYLDGPAPPENWPLGEGKWVITSALPQNRWRLPEGFTPAAIIPPFEDPARAAAAIGAVAFGWNLRCEVRPGHGGDGPLRRSRGEAGFDRADQPLLSAQETNVLEELARGEPNKGIASKLGVSESTVRFHIQNIYRKLGTRNRAGAVSRAFAKGLLII
jgi:DNA-binding CsgD family transcriptional regulator